jgi:hypothetical protein
MKRCIWLILLILSFFDISTAQAPELHQGDIAQRVQRLMDIEVGFEQMVPPGMSIEAKEISRIGTPDENLVVQYHVS